MSYNFRMQNLLDLKESIEQEKKEEYWNAVFELNREEDILEAIFKEKNSALESMETAKGRMDIVCMRRYDLYLRMIADKIEMQENKIEILRVGVEEKKSEMLKAMVDKKAFEKLKEHGYERFLQEERKAEDKVNDSIVTFNIMKKLCSEV